MFRERIITWFARVVGFLLPIQTVLILESAFVGGEDWQWGTTRIFLSSIVGTGFTIFLFIWSGSPPGLRRGWGRLTRHPEASQDPSILRTTLTQKRSMDPEMPQDDAEISHNKTSVKRLMIVFLLFTLLIPFNLISLILLFQWATIITLSIVTHKTPYGKDMLWGMTSVVIISIFLAIPQVLTGHQGRSVMLGISEQNAEQPGAFVVLFEHLRILRGSGIFQHPNIFGAWCALLTWLGLRLQGKKGLIIASIGVLGVALSMSRSALLMVMIIFLITVSWKKLRYAIIPLILIGTLRFFDGFSWQGINERCMLVREWWTVFTHSWIFGTGIGQYTESVHKLFPSKLGFALQPVHNTFLLMLAELGVVRVFLFSFLFFWRSSRRPTAPSPSSAQEGSRSGLLILLPPLLFDHFLWTTYSGSLLILFWVIIFTVTKKKS